MELDVPWIAEPQLRYQLELELVSGMSESTITTGYPKGFCDRATKRRYCLVHAPTEET